MGLGDDGSNETFEPFAGAWDLDRKTQRGGVDLSADAEAVRQLVNPQNESHAYPKTVSYAWPP